MDNLQKNKPANFMNITENARHCINRGWWASVEFDRQACQRKGHADALELLSEGKRHDFILENGQTVARGIFQDTKEQIVTLGRVLRLSRDWPKAAVHVNGLKLNVKQTTLFEKCMDCATNKRLCRTPDGYKRWTFLGCHTATCRIGFLNDRGAFQNKGKYWFDYYQQDLNKRERFILDMQSLESALMDSSICPCYPEKTYMLIQRLPSMIDFYNAHHVSMWMNVKQKQRHQKKTSAATRILPRNAGFYNQWITRLVDEVNH